MQEDLAYHRTILAIAAMVASIFLCETAYGFWLDSRFLIRDGLEWSYDLIIYVLAAASHGRGVRAERLAALGVALVLFVAGCITSWQVWRTYVDPPPVEVFSITLSGILIILEALLVAAALFRFRKSKSPIIEATWLSARNDAVTSTLYALVTMAARFYPERWPQMGVDMFSVALCWQAAWRILRDLRDERG